MKGKAESQPRNHVKWANGFESNMPDWPTARHCAVADRLLFAARESRTLLLAVQTGDVDQARLSAHLTTLQELCNWGDLGIESENPNFGGVTDTLANQMKKAMPPPPGFPKPPGVL